MSARSRCVSGSLGVARGLGLTSKDACSLHKTSVSESSLKRQGIVWDIYVIYIHSFCKGRQVHTAIPLTRVAYVINK